MENQHKKEAGEAQMVVDDLHHKIEAMSVSFDGFFECFLCIFSMFW
jgi:hypothetical protein